MIEKVLFSGVGGQGVLLMGTIFAQACVKERLSCSFVPSYGLEMRGGESNCWVTVSDDEIPSPIVSKPTSLIFVSDHYVGDNLQNVQSNGLVFLNGKNGQPLKKENIELFCIPATDIASNLGYEGAANMVLLGAYVCKTEIVAMNTIITCLKGIVKRKEVLNINISCLYAGAEMI